MIISKKTKHTQKTVKVPSIRINKNGHIVFNKAAVQLLEIEDNEKEGVVFGYQNNEPYVAYSTDEDCYKGMFKVGETSFRFGSKYESEQILSCFNVEDKSIVLSVSDEPKEIVMSEGYKLLKLKRLVV